MLEKLPQPYTEELEGPFVQQRVLHQVGLRVTRRAGRCGIETIQDVLDRSGWTFRLPTVCLVDGQFVLRTEWKTRLIRPDQQIIFHSRPRSPPSGLRGGNKWVAIGALIAVAVAAALVAGPFAPAIFGAGGLAITGGIAVGSTTIAYSAMAAYAAGAAIAIGGSLLVNAFLMPKPATDSASEDPGPSLVGAMGNQARPYQSLPVGYGRTQFWPDLAAPGYSEFKHNEQTVYQLLCLGLGKYDVEQIRVDDTVIWSDGEVEGGFEDSIGVRIYNPGEEIDFFPFNTTLAVEVSNLTLPGAGDDDWGNYVGPFAANEAGTLANKLLIDLVFPSGIFQGPNDNGGFGTRHMQVEFYAREINDAGAPIGDWEKVVDRSYSKRSREALYFTFEVDVDPGRYEVQGRRKRQQLDADEGADTAIWFGLRAHLKGPNSFPLTTMIALKFEIEDQEIADTVQKRVNVIATRKLKIREGGEWVNDQPTRSPIWACIDVWGNPDYSAARSLDAIDLDTFEYYADYAESRGDRFDHVFTSALPHIDAMRTTLRVHRSVPLILGDKLTMVRDEPRAVPTMILTDNEIVRGSFEIRAEFMKEDGADHTVVEFLNRQTWQADQVRCTLDDGTELKPANIRIDGITDFNHAYREGMYLLGVHSWRREYPAIRTEHDGRLLKFGDGVRLNSEIPDEWGEAAKVIEYDVGAPWIAVDPPPTWGGSQRYVEFRDKRGRPFGPVKVSEGDKNYIADIDPSDLADVEAQQGMTLSQALDRKAGADMPTVVFGTANKQAIDAVVLAFDPTGDFGRLAMVLDDPRIHTIDGTEVVPTPNEPKAKPPERPQIYNLKARLKQRDNDATLEVSWTQAYGAKRYIAQADTSDIDSAADPSWVKIWGGTATRFEVPADSITTKVRVRAIGKMPGPWVEADVEFPEYLTLVPTLTLTPLINENGKKDRGPYVKVEWAKPPRQGYEGIVIEWWPLDDDTKVRSKTIRSRNRTAIDIFEGIQRETAYRFRARFLFRGGLDGNVSANYDVTTEDIFDPDDAPVPVFSTFQGLARPSTGDKKRALISAVWTTASMRWPTAGDPPDPRIVGVEVRYRQDGEGTNDWQSETSRNTTDRAFRIFKGIRPNTTYEYQQRFLFTDSNVGNWSTQAEVVVPDIFDIGTAPVPNLALATITAQTATGDGGTQRAFFKIQIPSGNDARIRGVLFEVKEDAEADSEAVQKFFRNPLTIRLAEGIQKRTSYSFRAAYTFDQDYTGNFSSWLAGQVANDYLADPPDDAGAGNEIPNWSFERADSTTSTGAAAWTHETGSGFARASGNADHGDFALGRSASGTAAIEPVPERRLEAREGDIFNANVWAKRTGSVSFTSLFARVIFRNKAGTVLYSSGDSITTVGTVYEVLRTKDHIAPPSTFSVSIRVVVTSQSGGGTLWIDAVSLRRQAAGRDIELEAVNRDQMKSNIALPPGATVGDSAELLTTTRTRSLTPADVINTTASQRVDAGSVRTQNGDDTNMLASFFENAGPGSARSLKGTKLSEASVDDDKVLRLGRGKVFVEGGGALTGRTLSNIFDAGGLVRGQELLAESVDDDKIIKIGKAKVLIDGASTFLSNIFTGAKVKGGELVVESVDYPVIKNNAVTKHGGAGPFTDKNVNVGTENIVDFTITNAYKETYIIINFLYQSRDGTVGSPDSSNIDARLYVTPQGGGDQNLYTTTNFSERLGILQFGCLAGRFIRGGATEEQNLRVRVEVTVTSNAARFESIIATYITSAR